MGTVGEVLGFDAEFVEHGQVEVGQRKFLEVDVTAPNKESGKPRSAFRLAPACQESRGCCPKGAGSADLVCQGFSRGMWRGNRFPVYEGSPFS